MIGLKGGVHVEPEPNNFLFVPLLMSTIVEILSESGSYSKKPVSDPLIFNHVFVVVPVPTGT